jgi:YihY family inner membrane protein
MDLNRIKQRVDEAQQERRWLAFPVAVVKKFGDDDSSNLAVVITYYAFFSIFPLLLALASVLGFVLAGHPKWQSDIETSTLKKLPLIGKSPLPHSGSFFAVIFGTLLALYSGLAVVKAAQRAWDKVYCVARDDEPNFLMTNLRALRLVVLGGFGLILTTAIAGTVTSGKAIHINIGWALTIVGVIVSALLNTVVFVYVFRWLTVRELTIRDVLPGAGFAAVVLALLQSFATAFYTHKLQHTKATYGDFGTVIVLLSWFYLQSQVLLLAAQLNVVRQDRLWPRSLAEN